MYCKLSEASPITIGLLAHVDAGKTTFAEQLLYHASGIKTRGRVDHQDAFLDSHEMERARGITIFADQAVMKYNEQSYQLIDTPGHVDFSAEMERALQVMDYAVVILSAVEGIEGHTETVWQLLQEYGIPTFIFINKIDRTGADVQRVLKALRQQFSPDMLYLANGLDQSMLPEEVITAVAERDEALMEAYLEDNIYPGQVLATLKQMVKERVVFPVMSGAALLDQGIAEWMQTMQLLMESTYEVNAVFRARVYKVRHELQGTRLTFMKILAGKLRVREDLCYSTSEHEELSQKITSIRIYHGGKYTSCDEASAGQLVAVTGLTDATIGLGIGNHSDQVESRLVSALKSKVVFNLGISSREVLRYFMILQAEDPTLQVTWEDKLEEIHVHVMGMIQLEVLQQVVLDRFQLKVSFSNPEILYKETIADIVIGCGHFEPLKHYAEVHLRLAPAKRGEGITYRSTCHVEQLSTGYQHLVGQHLLEKDHRGVLTGSPVTDLYITLLTGAAHQKHTHGGDFREATLRALRQGLEQANKILLEPYYQFKIKVDAELIGRVMSDIQLAHGEFDPPEMLGESMFIQGRAPVATFMHYAVELASFTKGKGAISMKLGGYQPCHNPEQVIARIGYDRSADPEYTSSSMFCAKGAGYSVPWDEAPSYMHLEIQE
ncbi:translation factor GTPase family protein [Paenibacillus sp. FSL E2-8871]|uniref:translation factor GTPase family protein n=1 Tax=Paenibacillus sp. FSL E2-8871 TaxID=2975326 RepID=UPI0030F85B92